MLFSSFAVISDVYRSFIQNKTTFTKYYFTQWISKLPAAGSFEIHRVRQYLINFMGLAGKVKATVYTRPSQFSEVSGMRIVLIFNIVYTIHPHPFLD